jgi:hypothetical protein
MWGTFIGNRYFTFSLSDKTGIFFMGPYIFLLSSATSGYWDHFYNQRFWLDIIPIAIQHLKLAMAVSQSVKLIYSFKPIIIISPAVLNGCMRYAN